MIANTDVDIDVADRDVVLASLPHVAACIRREDANRKHNTGVYFQSIPHDPRQGFATLDHKDAEELGYFKIDFLNNSVYEGVKDEAHLDRLLNTPPNWDLLAHDEIIEQLFHIHSYAPLVRKLKPRSIEDLAIVLAVIRPAKAFLQDKNWNVIRSKVWEKPTNGTEYHFKKSHSIAYAAVIVVQLNLIIEQLSKSS